MNLKTFTIIIALLFLFSCQNEKADFKNDKLVGVWSGILFQTETKYDSIVLQPIVNPTKATLYKNGKEKSFELNNENTYLFFKSGDGLRLDATYRNDSPNLYGVITNELWSQSLTFLKRADKWVTDIQKPEIIDTDYTVYLEFYEDSLGTLQAKIQSNKENRRLHFEIDSVKIAGDHIDFDITNDRFGISAEYNSNENNILLAYGNAGGKREIQLTKLKSSDLNGYQPLSKEAYVYKVPNPVDNFIETASLKEVGINTSMFDFMPKMNSGKYDHIHSIIVTKNSKLIFEEYFHAYNREYLHDIKSSFKSISSLLLGKTIMQSERINVENPILNYYPEYEISDKEKKGISIHHALTMSTGLQLEDEDEMQWSNNDWVAYKLSLPMEHRPGEKYEYSSGGMNLLTGVIQKSTEKYLPLFFYEEVLLPMGIQRFQMRTSPKGRAYLPGDFYLRPIDLAKFGILVLNDGKWNNQQIIASDWINISTQPHIKGSWPKNSDYGYLWRLLERKVGGKKMKTIEAWGNGGQFLIIIPEVEMTITFTGGNYNLFPEMEEKPFEILEKYILPAVMLNNN
ncbi:MAG: serine hydrolase [Bacteroidota bacterium]